MLAGRGMSAEPARKTVHLPRSFRWHPSLLSMQSPTHTQKLLIANQREITIHILRTARRLQIPTVTIYTQSDATSLHVTLADEAVPLRPADTDAVSNARGYLDISEIVSICVKHAVTIVHPGYGFLSENADFARALLDNGISWAGPRPDIIRSMGLKHEARSLAKKAGIPIVPGSEGLPLQNVEEALASANAIGYPVILKATAGGGGMGMIICASDADIVSKFQATSDRAAVGYIFTPYVYFHQHHRLSLYFIMTDYSWNVILLLRGTSRYR
jgi:urea carboxylase